MNLDKLVPPEAPEGAEGVICAGSEYYWYKFSTGEHYSNRFGGWRIDTDPQHNKVIIDYRKQRVLDGNKAESSGLSCNYYVVQIKTPTSTGKPYIAECNDIIEVLKMKAAEANVFKEIWRSSAASALGKEKAGHTAKRGAEKVAFFGIRYALSHGVKLEDLRKTLDQMEVKDV